MAGGPKVAYSAGAGAANRPMALNSSGYLNLAFFEDDAIRGLLGVTADTDKLPYFDSASSAALTDLTSAGRDLIGAADAAAQLLLIGAVDPAAAEFTADVDMGGFVVTNLGNPSNANDAVNLVSMQNYVAGQLTNLNWKTPAVKAATTGALVGAYNYSAGVITFTSNGAFPSIDGVAIGEDEDILVKNEADAEYNGIYTLTTVGDAGTAAVLTRRSDFNSSSNIKTNSVVSVAQGTTNHDTLWLMTADGTITVGTTELTFQSFTSSVDSSSLPQALGSASAGNSTLASPANHVHPTTGLILATGANDFTGQQKFSAMALASTAFKNANYTVGSTDYAVPVNSTSGAVTITLPSNPTIGRVIEVWRAIGGNTVTVACSGSDNFKILGSDASSFDLLTVDESVRCTYFGNNVWRLD